MFNPETNKSEKLRHDKTTAPQVAAAVSQNLTDMPNLPEAPPLLEFRDLKSLSSWKDVVQAYQRRGLNFSRDEDYLTQASRDWSKHIKLLLEQARTAPLPNSFPRTTLQIDGKSIEIFGIFHSMSVHPDLVPVLRISLSRCPLLLTEQNLGLLNMGLHSSGLDLPDHFARGFGACVIANEAQQLRAISSWIRRQIAKFGFSDRLKRTDAVNVNQITTKEGAEFAALQKQFGLRDSTISLYSRLSISMPSDWFEKVPANITLAYKHEKGLPYNRSEARSAYMAEFLRHWDINQTLKGMGGRLSPAQIRQLSDCKQLLCGQAHEAEIAFFLKNGSREEGVRLRARRDAEILSKYGSLAFFSMIKRKAMYLMFCNISIGMAKGAAAGAGFFWILNKIFA